MKLNWKHYTAIIVFITAVISFGAALGIEKPWASKKELREEIAQRKRIDCFGLRGYINSLQRRIDDIVYTQQRYLRARPPARPPKYLGAQLNSNRERLRIARNLQGRNC